MGHFHIAKVWKKSHHSNGAKKPRPRSHPAYQTDCLRSCGSNSMDLLRCGSTVDRTWIKNWVWKALEDEIPTYSYWIWPWFRLFKHRLTSFFIFRWEKTGATTTKVDPMLRRVPFPWPRTHWRNGVFLTIWQSQWPRRVYLAGGWPTPPKNMKVSWGYYSQHMENKTCSKPPTSFNTWHYMGFVPGV